MRKRNNFKKPRFEVKPLTADEYRRNVVIHHRVVDEVLGNNDAELKLNLPFNKDSFR